MTEDMSRAKVTAAHADAHWTGHGMSGLKRIVNGAGDFLGWNWIDAASRLPAEPKVEVVEHEPLEWGTNCLSAPDRGPHECGGQCREAHHTCLRCGVWCLCKLCNQGNLRTRSSVTEMWVHTDTSAGRVMCIDPPIEPQEAEGGGVEQSCKCVGELHDESCRCTCTDHRKDPLCQIHRPKEAAPIDPTLTGQQRREAVELRLRFRARFDQVSRVEEKLLIGDGWTPTAYDEKYVKAVGAWILSETLLEEANIKIHDLESNCDPAGNVQQIASLKGQVYGLLQKLNVCDGDGLIKIEPKEAAPEDAGPAGWIAVPDNQGYWWHWDKNPDVRPFIYHVQVSHVQVSKTGPDRYFIDYPDSRWCDEVGGVWQKVAEPATEGASETTRCIHGVWAADHCYQCGPDVTNGPKAEGVEKPAEEFESWWVEFKPLKCDGWLTIKEYARRAWNAATANTDALESRNAELSLCVTRLNNQCAEKDDKLQRMDEARQGMPKPLVTPGQLGWYLDDDRLNIRNVAKELIEWRAWAAGRGER